MATLTLVAAYDVSSDPRRARLAALLQGYGDRIQKSVFIVRADATGIEDLRRRAEGILNLNEDSLYLFSQCGTCWTAIGCIGQAGPAEPVLYWAVL